MCKGENKKIAHKYSENNSEKVDKCTKGKNL